MHEHEEKSASRKPGLRVIDGSAEFAAGRTPPHSREAEEYLISTCLIDGSATIARCLARKISGRAFHVPANRIIFDVMVQIHQQRPPVAIEVLAEELKTKRLLEEIGGIPYLLQVSQRIPTTAQADYFIEKVLELWMLRELIKQGTTVVEESYAFTGGLEDLVSKWATKFQRMADFAQGANRASQRDQAAAARAAALQAAAGKVDTSRWLYLGLPYADAAFQPYDVKNEDWYVVVAGPPSGGKSSEMRQTAGYNCLQGKCGVVFLLETSMRRWLQALAATFAHVNLRDLAILPPDMLKQFDEWMAVIESWVEERLWVFDDVFYIEDIERITREINRKVRERKIAAGEDPEKAWGLDFAVVDYLQLVDMREKFRGQREEKIAAISKAHKRLFKSLNITGFVGAQLNRKSREESRRPKLTDLRESGAIEQDADAVLALFTPENDASGNKQDGNQAVDEMELIQLKRRNGPRDVAVDVLFYKKQARFQDAKKLGDARPGLPKPADGYKGKGQ